MQNIKVAITGHTKGIGKAFASYFKDYEVHGFSRSNGWDLFREESLNALVHNIKDFDILVNSAPIGVNQLKLFDRVFELWEGKDKSIINISSIGGDMDAKIIKDFQDYYVEKLDGGENAHFPSVLDLEHYITNKVNLDKSSSSKVLNTNLRQKGLPYILNLKSGAVDTEFLHAGPSNLMKHYLTVDEFMKVFDTVWQLKDTARITSITFLGNNEVNGLW